MRSDIISACSVCCLSQAIAGDKIRAADMSSLHNDLQLLRIVSTIVATYRHDVGQFIMRSSLRGRIMCCTRLSVRPSRASDFLEAVKYTPKCPTVDH